MAAGPRIEPVDPETCPPDVAELLALTKNPHAPASNIFATLARHPGLLRRWIPFYAKLLVGGKLADRDRELVILRTAHRCGSGYEFRQHALIAAAAGVTAAEIAAVADGAGDWSERDLELLGAADELHETATVSDATWAALSAHLDEQQLIELVVVIGAYTAAAFFLNAVRVEPEPELA